MRRPDNCRFCDILNGSYRFIGVDEPIAENEEFVAIASIGAMVPGWTLILPKTHHCSMKKLFKKNSFVDLVNKMTPKLFNRRYKVVAFEHGANKKGSLTGCGIDHAHLHLVPLKGSLFTAMQESKLNWIEIESSQISSVVGSNEYLFYAELQNGEIWHDPRGQLHILKSPISQYFRKLIGHQTGKADSTDYKLHPYLKVAKQTRSALILP